MNTDVADRLLESVKTKLSSQIISAELNIGDVEARVSKDKLYDFIKLLKLDSELDFNMLLSLTAVDWMDTKEDRFEIVYHLLSTTKRHRIRIKAALAEDDLEVQSVCDLWSGANFMEREVYDMYGVKFKNHPDLRRILLYDEFVGYPLRKDYPLRAKQPRIKLRHPEVHNTARDMLRPDLVKIGRRHSEGPGHSVLTQGGIPGTTNGKV